MNLPGKAVFLSYASQDAEAAKRICDALRAAGIEVWFDQSELRGGDAWDAKIRRQIKECALFVPVISPNTNARPEGYFRLEWKLAVDRSHLMADDAPFLFPIAIGDVTDATARVPDKFREVQWTKLRLDETPAELAARVARLLSGGSLEPGRRRPDPGGEGAAAPSRREEKGFEKWWWLIFPIMGMAIPIIGMLKKSDPPPRPSKSAPVPESPDVRTAEARALVEKALPLHTNMGGATRGDFELAGEMLRRALELAPLDAEVWANYSWYCTNYIGISLDRTPERAAEAKRAADRAIKLDPTSDLARFVWANHYRNNEANRPEAIKILVELAERYPDRAIMHRVLHLALEGAGRGEEAIKALEPALARGDAHAWTNAGQWYQARQRYDEAEAAFAQSVAIVPAPRTLLRVALFQASVRGDLAAAQAAFDRVPGEFMAEDRAVGAALLLALWQRRPAGVEKILGVFPKELVEDSFYSEIIGARAEFVGWARWLEGKPDLARREWAGALRAVDGRLALRPNDGFWLRNRAELLALLGRHEEAAAAVELYAQAAGESGTLRALLLAWDGKLDAAIGVLAGEPVTPWIRYGPEWDPLRGHPDFARLLGSPSRQ